MSNNTCHILSLPPELIIRVAAPLTTPELGNFRRSCQYVESSLFDSFSREFFTKRQFMFEHVSLQALVDIANHKTLSKRLTNVIFGLDCFPEVNELFEDDFVERNQKAAIVRRKRLGYLSQKSLLATGQAKDMLVEAFSKLPNLRTIGLRDYHANGRTRDGEMAQWRSYGWTCGLGADAIHGLHAHGCLTVWTRLSLLVSVVPLLFYSLGKAHARPNSIEAFLRRQSIPPEAFDVTNAFFGPSVLPLLVGLDHLMLRVQGRAQINTFPENEWQQLQEFLLHTPNLRHLRLNFTHGHLSASPSLLRWLATDCPLQFLDNLEIGIVQIPGEVLLQLLEQFQLKTLSLWKCTLLVDDNAPAYDESCIWAGFLKAASSMNFTRLESVLIGFGTERSSRGRISEVNFADSVLTDKDGGLKYQGSKGQISFNKRSDGSVQGWLADVATRVFRPRIDGVENDNSEDDDSGSGIDAESDMDDEDHALEDWQSDEEDEEGHEGSDDDWSDDT